MSNSIHEAISLSSSLRDRINDSNNAYSRQNSILSQSTVANSDAPAHRNGHHQVMVHNFDSQSISRSILEDTTIVYQETSDVNKEKDDIISNKKENVAYEKNEENNVLQNLDYKIDENDANLDNKNTSENGSKSFTLVQSGDSSSHDSKSRNNNASVVSCPSSQVSQLQKPDVSENTVPVEIGDEKDVSMQAPSLLGSKTISSIPFHHLNNSDNSSIRRHLDSRAKTSSSFSRQFPKYPPENFRNGMETLSHRNGTTPIKTNPNFIYPRYGLNGLENGICENGVPRNRVSRSTSLDTSYVLDRSASQVGPMVPKSLPNYKSRYSRRRNDLSKISNTRSLKIIREKPPVYLNAKCESTCSLNGPHIIVDRHRRVDEDSMTLGAKCCFTFLMLITQILLHGVVGLVLYWVWMFHKGDDPKSWHPFAWRENPRKEFNLHPVLMIVGFVYCMGQAMLMYRSCRCCRRIANKLLHTVFHLLAMPCIAIAFVATYDSHTNRTVPCEQGECPAPIPNFYSLHSWMGLTTMGLFAMQFIVGFFSFLLLLCCESATASFRANLVPIHSTFGITTFVMAIATCCSGLTEKAFFTLSIGYKEWVRFAAYPSLWSTEDQDEEYTAEMFSESIVINTLGACLIALMFTVPILLLYPKFRYRPQRIITVTTHHKGTHDRYA